MKKGQRIRSYVLHPKQFVVDHRTGVRSEDAFGVLDGNLDAFIEANLLADIHPPIPNQPQRKGIARQRMTSDGGPD